MTLHPEDHTKNRGQTAPRERQRPYVEREEDNQRAARGRRSVTASYYSVGNNNFAKYPHNTGDDYTAVNTVKAVADENDYKTDREKQSDNASDTANVEEETKTNNMAEDSKVELDENSDEADAEADADPDEEDQRQHF